MNEREAEKISLMVSYISLHQYVLERLGLDQTVGENNLMELCKMSLQRLNSSLTENQLLSSFSQTDCRRTSSIVKKKILLIMHLEKKLDIRLDDVISTEIDTMEELVETFYAFAKKGYGAK